MQCLIHNEFEIDTNPITHYDKFNVRDKLLKQRPYNNPNSSQSLTFIFQRYVCNVWHKNITWISFHFSGVYFYIAWRTYWINIVLISNIWSQLIACAWTHTNQCFISVSSIFSPRNMMKNKIFIYLWRHFGFFTVLLWLKY